MPRRMREPSRDKRDAIRLPAHYYLSGLDAASGFGEGVLGEGFARG